MDLLFQFIVANLVWIFLNMPHAPTAESVATVTGCDITVYADEHEPALTRITTEDLCGMSVAAFTSSGHLMEPTEVWLVALDKASTSEFPKLEARFERMFGTESEARDKLLSIWYGDGVIQISPRVFSYDSIEVPMKAYADDEVRAYETMFGLGVIASAVLSDHAYRFGTPPEDVVCTAMMKEDAPWQKVMWDMGRTYGVQEENVSDVIVSTLFAYATPHNIQTCVSVQQTSQDD